MEIELIVLFAKCVVSNYKNFEIELYKQLKGSCFTNISTHRIHFLVVNWCFSTTSYSSSKPGMY